MSKPDSIQTFDKLVKSKFNIYNSLFLELPFPGVSHIGMLVPLLQHHCRSGLEAGKEPLEILDSFFSLHPEIRGEKERIDFMFRVIQYVERQVVLFDSVEDAAFRDLQKQLDHLSLEEFIHLLERTNSRGEIVDRLSAFSARIVFTAHPTQFYPPAVLGIISRLRMHVQGNDIHEIDLALQQLGLTTFMNTRKPTPMDEARNILYFMENIYYDAVGELYGNIKRQLGDAGFDNPELIKLGFWPGGDRDGNPFVTSGITLEVADALRMTLMKCYHRDVVNLQNRLTFRMVEQPLAEVGEKVYRAMVDAGYRLDPAGILAPLLQVREQLVEHCNSLYLDALDGLIDKVRIFRTHFAVLDIRQDHSIHRKTVDAILKQAGLVKESHTELGHARLIEVLLRERPGFDEERFDDELAKDTVRTIRHLPRIQEMNGEEGCNRYIISNSEDVFSVLFVHALFRWTLAPGQEIRFDIVPLFETMEGMRNSTRVMQDLFGIPEYRAHVERRHERQTIMLGFSDGTKDGGYLAANWSIYTTKENLSQVCSDHGVKAIFFDGRGGPPARGGGKTHRFYAAQSSRTSGQEIQLTIQGQTISSKYGSRDHFRFHFEQLLTAGLSNIFQLRNKEMAGKDRLLLEELARLSFEKYSALKQHPAFLPYLEKKSTLKYYGMANIGSRPAKRGNKDKLELSDLRAISFVGSWSQLKQNVPGYYGIGHALKTMEERGLLEEMVRLFREVPFFKALVMNSMMSLSKSNFALTSYISRDPEFKEFWQLLHEEFKLAGEMVLKVSGYSRLMEEEPLTRSSIAMREQIVLPLLVIQQYALQQVEKNDRYRAAYEKMVTRSLYGNINASRNSA